MGPDFLRFTLVSRLKLPGLPVRLSFPLPRSSCSLLDLCGRRVFEHVHAFRVLRVTEGGFSYLVGMCCLPARLLLAGFHVRE